MRGKLTFVTGLTLAAIACGDNAAWDEALRRSAPPNPYTATKHQQQTLERQAKQERDQAPRARSESPAAAVTPAEERVTGIEITLEGYPDCYSGAIRLYVDRRFVATFDGQGQLRLELTPGRHTLMVWDSSSRWRQEVNISEGRIAPVMVPCSGREPLINEEGGGR